MSCCLPNRFVIVLQGAERHLAVSHSRVLYGSALDSPSVSALARQRAQMVLSQVIQAVIRYGAHQTGAR